jgi:DNA repair protein RecO (recombination protein O)
VNKHTTKAIVLSRVDYGDSDRIITILTPEYGKLSLMAKGVRKINSKLAGGIELFSIFDAGFVMGRGEVGRLTSSRLIKFYSNVINDIERVQLGYEILKSFSHNIEDNVESGYFYLLCQLLSLLDEPLVSTTRLTIYFKAKMLSLAGHGPNLRTDEKGKPLKEDETYDFNILSMSFYPAKHGRYTSSHIKLMRVLFDTDDESQIFKVNLKNKEDEDLKPLIDAMFKAHLSV